ELVKHRQRSGHTVCIEWPLWREGGMKVDAAVRRRMTNLSGLVELETDVAVGILNATLSRALTRALVLCGDSEKIHAHLAPATSAAPDRVAALSPDASRTVKQALAGMVSTLLKIEENDIDGNSEWSEFGFDSISLTELATRISEKYSLELAPT